MDLRDVYRQNVGAVYAYFGYHVAHDVAEDLTAATFERVIRFWGSFDPARARPGAWILGIARNVLFDHYAARSARTLSLNEYPEVAGRLVSTDDPARSAMSDDALQELLGLLSDRQREVFALRYGADLSPAEIAATLDLSVANVYQLLSRGLRQLREQLGGSTAEKRRPKEPNGTLVANPAVPSGISDPGAGGPTRDR